VTQQPDNTPETLRRVITAYLEHGHEVALQALAPISHPPREVGSHSPLSLTLRVQIYRRDRWTCRYCGKQTIFEPVMALVGSIFPQDFPYHENWKAGLVHPAVLTQGTSLDHIIPVSRHGSWTDPGNLVTACTACNYGKGARLPEEMGWTLRTIPEATGWHGLTDLYRPLWEAAGCPKPDYHRRVLRELERTAP
jgi:5-methylcytosine-specific restriction endonuclease McrA